MSYATKEEKIRRAIDMACKTGEAFTVSPVGNNGYLIGRPEVIDCQWPWWWGEPK